MSNPYLIAARSCGRRFPVYMRTVSIYSNNYRKLHGLSMMRHVHLRKIEKKKINDAINDFYKLLIQESKNYYMGIDLANCEDFYTPTYVHPITGKEYYSAKPINQNVVCKIVTNAED